jgi:hypothetical protein
MFVGAVFTKPPLVPALAIGADLRCGFLSALLAGNLGCIISRQQLDSLPMRSPVPKSEDFQAEFGCRAVVILVGEHHSWLKDSAELHVHSRFLKVIQGLISVTLSFYREGPQVPTTFYLDLAQKIIHTVQRFSHRPDATNTPWRNGHLRISESFGWAALLALLPPAAWGRASRSLSDAASLTFG